MEKDSVIVLDLDETLIHASDRGLPTRFSVHSSPTSSWQVSTYDNRKEFVREAEKTSGDDPFGIKWNYEVIPRPYLQEFLRVCRDNFDYVVVWSAGDKDYVLEICKVIFSEYKPDLIWSYKDCKRVDGRTVKPLAKLAAKMGLPLEGFIHVDDTPSTYSENPKNGVHICQFRGRLDDNSLETLSQWIERGHDMSKKPLLCPVHR